MSSWLTTQGADWPIGGDDCQAYDGMFHSICACDAYLPGTVGDQRFTLVANIQVQVHDQIIVDLHQACMNIRRVSANLVGAGLTAQHVETVQPAHLAVTRYAVYRKIAGTMERCLPYNGYNDQSKAYACTERFKGDFTTGAHKNRPWPAFG